MDRTQCSCGHRFAARDSDDARTSGELLVQAEILHESFLTARLQRARKMCETAKLDLRRNPTNRRLAAQVKEAMRELESLQVQLAQQTARTAETRERVEAAKLELARAGQPAPADAGTPKVSADKNFRTAQSAKAIEAVQSATIKRLLEAYRSGNPEAIFKAAQALRAEQSGRTPPAEASGSLPSEFLTQDEITALRKPDGRS